MLCTSFNVLANSNEAVAIPADYANAAMHEVAAAPPLSLVKNEKGKSHHGLSFGLVEMKV